MKGKLKFIVPLVLLLVLGGVYKFVLAKPAAGRQAQGRGRGLRPAQGLPRSTSPTASSPSSASASCSTRASRRLPPAAAEGGAAPPTGYGVLAQEAVVRDIVTDVVTDESAQRPDEPRRAARRSRSEILKRLKAQTDVKAHEVLLTDVAVQ